MLLICRTISACLTLPRCSRKRSSSGAESKWSSIAFLPLPVTMMMFALLDHVLDQRLVHHRQHFLWLCLGSGQKPRPQPCRGQTRLAHAIALGCHLTSFGISSGTVLQERQRPRRRFLPLGSCSAGLQPGISPSRRTREEARYSASAPLSIGQLLQPRRNPDILEISPHLLWRHPPAISQNPHWGEETHTTEVVVGHPQSLRRFFPHLCVRSLNQFPEWRHGINRFWPKLCRVSEHPESHFSHVSLDSSPVCAFDQNVGSNLILEAVSQDLIRAQNQMPKRGHGKQGSVRLQAYPDSRARQFARHDASFVTRAALRAVHNPNARPRANQGFQYSRAVGIGHEPFGMTR